MRRRTQGAAALLAAGVLAGCGSVHPGAAASVDGEEIALGTVDDMALAVCSAQVAVSSRGGGEVDPHMSTYRNLVLSTLVNDALATRATERLGIDVPASAYDRDTSGLDDIFAALPSDQDDDLRDFLEISGRLQAATRLIGQQVGDDASADAADSAGLQYLVDEADHTDIDLDPRFGELTSGQVVGGSGSLSAPLDGAQARTPVEDLPFAQVCS